MSYKDEANAIRSRFYSEWDETTEIAWPNKNFDPPDKQPWVRLEIEPAGADRVTMGGKVEYDGTVSVQVFVPQDQGDGEARDLAEQVCGIYRDAEIGEITFGTPHVTTGGLDGRGWYMLNVWCPYMRETTH